jgi:hypothetical protein
MGAALYAAGFEAWDVTISDLASGRFDLAAASPAVRGLVSMPVHCVCSAFTALRLAVRDGQLDRLDELRAAAGKGGLWRFVKDAPPPGKAPPPPPRLPPPGKAPPPPPQRGGSGASSDDDGDDEAATLLAAPAVIAAAETGGAWQLALSADEARAAADALQVWSWPRVIWPAILVHGVFDAQALLLAAALAPTVSDGLISSLTLLLGVFTMTFALWILWRQYERVFAALDRGDAPRAVSAGCGTCRRARCAPRSACCGRRPAGGGGKGGSDGGGGGDDDGGGGGGGGGAGEPAVPTAASGGSGDERAYAVAAQIVRVTR